MDLFRNFFKLCAGLSLMYQPQTGANLLNNPALATGKHEDVYLLLDCSRSMWKYDRLRLQHWLAQLASGLDIGNGTRVGLGLYSTSHTVSIPINNTYSKQQLVDRINTTQCHETENTYISRAIRGMMTDGLPESQVMAGRPRVCILTTDGESRSKIASQDNASEAKRKKIYMMTIGIGNDIDKDEMNYIASEPKSDFANIIPDYDGLNTQLKDKVTQVLSKAEARDSNRSACGWDEEKPFDTVLVYDEAALGKTTTSRVIRLFKEFADMIDINSGNMRLSVYPKRCEGGNSQNIELNKFTKSSTFKDGLDQLEGQHDGLHGLVKEVRLNAFKSERGGRYWAGRRLVLVLDEELTLGSPLHKQTLWARSSLIEIFVVYLGAVRDPSLVYQHSFSDLTDSHSLILASPADLDTQQARDFFKDKFCDGLYYSGN